MVSYPLEMLVKAGITDIAVVTTPDDSAPFQKLTAGAKLYPDARIRTVTQEHPGGIAQALSAAATILDDRPTVVVLGDNIFERSIAPAIAQFLREPTGCQLLLSKLESQADLKEVGVAELVDGQIVDVVEKPVDPPSQYAVTGVYCYDADVFSILSTLKPSERGEFEITDVNAAYLDRGLLKCEITNGFWGDAGLSINHYYAVNDFVRRYGANR
jgi:glucose-1-phosphate thymidylyltransferase